MCEEAHRRNAEVNQNVDTPRLRDRLGVLLRLLSASGYEPVLHDTRSGSPIRAFRNQHVEVAR